AEVVEDHARLHARDAPLRVDLQDPVQVLGEVEDDGDVRCLAGETRAAAARENRDIVRAADLDGGDDVLDRARDDDADRHLAVVRAAGRIERPRARAEPHLALDDRCELAGQAAGVELGYRRDSPFPGCERLGRRTPPSGSGAPSKSSVSTRMWSWNHSR